MTGETFHSNFTITRRYDAPRSRVYGAWSDPAARDRWFVSGDGWELTEYSHDFRIGGEEHGRFRRAGGGPLIRNETLYYDIVPDQRVIFAYTMFIEGKPISVSLATVEFLADGSGTQLIFTEQGAFFDDREHAPNREKGWKWLLEQFAKELQQHWT